MFWDPHDPISYFLHVILGYLALTGGLVALSSKKGSVLHKKAGMFFAYPMLVVILTTIVFMFTEFLPLAIVLAAMSLYFILSAISSARYQKPYAARADKVLFGIPLLLCLFTGVQFVRFLNIENAPVVGPLVLCLMGGFFTFQDVLILRRRPLQRNIWIRRHLLRMLFAFTFAVMALIRIGINFGLTLEQTVIYPIIATLPFVWYFYRKFPVERTPLAANVNTTN